MKVLIADKFQSSGIDALRSLGIDVESHPDTSPDDLPALCAKPPFSNLLRLDDLTVVDGDLVLQGRSILELTQRDWIGCIGIAQERYQAAAWLCGDDPVYSDVDTPT